MPAELVVQQPSTKEILLQAVLSGKVGVDVVERLTALARQEVEYEAMVEFNEAMHRCQEKMKRISTDMENPQTHSRYASFAQIDRAIRPIYTAEGISLSFSDGEPLGADMMRIICYVSRGGYTRMYSKNMPIVTVGPQGKAVMTPTHATGSAGSYAKRYLVKDIFNLAIGEDDDDGNGGLHPTERDELVGLVEGARTLEDLKAVYIGAVKTATQAKDATLVELLTRAKDERKKALS